MQPYHNYNVIQHSKTTRGRAHSLPHSPLSALRRHSCRGRPLPFQNRSSPPSLSPTPESTLADVALSHSRPKSNNVSTPDLKLAVHRTASASESNSSPSSSQARRSSHHLCTQDPVSMNLGKHKDTEHIFLDDDNDEFDDEFGDELDDGFDNFPTEGKGKKQGQSNSRC